MVRSDCSIEDNGEEHSLRVLLAGCRNEGGGFNSVLSRVMPPVRIVALACDGRQAVDLAVRFSPQIVIMDFDLAELNAIDCTRQIKLQTQAGVLILADQPKAGPALDAIRAGASAFLSRSPSYEELSLALNAALAGWVFISPRVMTDFIEELHILSTSGNGNEVSCRGTPELTARQRQVLKLLAEGATTKDLAERLHISSRTVETHRVQLMNRLHIHSMAELTKYAIRQGLTTL